MPLWLLSAWRFLKPLMPYIAVVLVVAGLLSAYGHREYGRGVASQQAKTAAEHARAEGFLANQIALTAALNRQNEAVAALRKEGDQRKADGKAALEAVQRANASLSAKVDALRKSAGRKVDATPCPTSEALQKVGAV